MAIWYELEITEKGINDFLDANWRFHDFRHEKIEYAPGKDMVEIFLKYDSLKEGVLLRFAWIHDVHINTKRDYDANWIGGSEIIPLKGGAFIWIDEDGFDVTDEESVKEVKEYTTWVEAERLFWAVTDGEGNPVEMPADRIDQIWTSFGKEEHKHFELKEFKGNFNGILKPWYRRV